MLKVTSQPKAMSERVRFKCWKCRHRFSVARNRAGNRVQCDCGEFVRVPRRDHGDCRIYTVFGQLARMGLVGGGCGLVALLVAMFAGPRLGHEQLPKLEMAAWAAGAALVGILIGGPIINVVGTFVRARQKD